MEGVHEGFHPLGARGDGEHPKAVEAKLRPVDGLRPGGFVGAELPVERSLREIFPWDRHRGPVGFEEEKGALAGATGIFEIQCEHVIRDDAQPQAAR